MQLIKGFTYEMTDNLHVPNTARHAVGRASISRLRAFFSVAKDRFSKDNQINCVALLRHSG